MIPSRPVEEKETYTTEDCAWYSADAKRCWGPVSPCVDLYKKSDSPDVKNLVLAACCGHGEMVDSFRYVPKRIDLT